MPNIYTVTTQATSARPLAELLTELLTDARAEEEASANTAEQ